MLDRILGISTSESQLIHSSLVKLSPISFLLPPLLEVLPPSLLRFVPRPIDCGNSNNIQTLPVRYVSQLHGYQTSPNIGHFQCNRSSWPSRICLDNTMIHLLQTLLWSPKHIVFSHTFQSTSYKQSGHWVHTRDHLPKNVRPCKCNICIPVGEVSPPPLAATPLVPKIEPLNRFAATFSLAWYYLSPFEKQQFGGHLVLEHISSGQ